MHAPKEWHSARPWRAEPLFIYPDTTAEPAGPGTHKWNRAMKAVDRRLPDLRIDLVLLLKRSRELQGRMEAGR